MVSWFIVAGYLLLVLIISCLLTDLSYHRQSNTGLRLVLLLLAAIIFSVAGVVMFEMAF